MGVSTVKHLRFMQASAILLGILVLGGFHFLTTASQNLWYNIFQHLFILPIAMAAIYFGWSGGLVSAMLAAACYSAPILIQRPFQAFLVSQRAEIVDFFLVGLVAGVLAERERKQKLALQHANQQLSRIYQELQDNFERMKRSERLYAIGQLSAGLAHEVRNPLASIEGAVTIMQQEPGSVERRLEFLEIIQKECRRLNRLLTNFLEFARPRTPQYQKAEMGLILDSVIGLGTHAIGQRAVTFRKEIGANLPSLECDPEQLKQVILNLTINAIQAMTEAGEIVLAARPKEGKILVEVKDQGGGINPDLLDRIFDPFFTTKENGTGMGLSVAHQIVVQHGGLLTAKSNEYGGMTFSILLPLQHGRVL
jgi:two-component system sensor histidine kinase HydH